MGSLEMKDRWLDPMVVGWVDGVKKLARVAEQYPQTAYTEFIQSLQAEWQYISRCVPGTEKYLGPVEKAIWELLLPALLGVPAGEVHGGLRALLGNGIKQGSLNVRNPTEAAERLHKASSEADKTLIHSLVEGHRLDLVLHQQTVRKAGTEARK